MTELVLTDRAVLALINDAERALGEVSTPEDADALWRKIQAVEEAARLARVSEVVVATVSRFRLRAKRKYGELLGPAQVGAPKGNSNAAHDNVTGGHVDSAAAGRKAAERARKLAEIPEPVFEAHLAEAEPDDLTEAAVLRSGKAGRPDLGVHFSSETDEWATPQPVFDMLAREFPFDLDVCALDSSAKCERYFTPELDGLAHDWRGVCWMNPPYGREIGRWVAKARESAEAGATVVCLLPARVDTGWWWDHCRYGEVRFLRGRLKFGDATTGAPFPSAVVVFMPNQIPSVQWWDQDVEEAARVAA